MRRFFRNLSVLLLCGILSCQMMEGRGRNNGNNGNSGNGARPAASASQQRPGGNSGGRPNTGTGRPNSSNNKPQGGNSGYNPGGGNHGGGPGYNPGPGAPGHNPGPGGPGPNYGFGPGPGGPGFGPGPGGPGFGPGPSFGYPSRPYMPAPHPWSRPTPPPPGYAVFSGPSISTILGVALGTTLNYALNSLVNGGYAVTGYSNNNIYLNDVMQLNMMWPYATMHYANGLLVGSEFTYSTPYYDMNRYNLAYTMLANTYGLPYSSNAYGVNGISTTWWGPNGQFITLRYAPATASNGMLRYYTTLSFGN